MSETKPVSSGFAEVPGARLYYEIAGEGEPLVFLHGGMIDRRMWDEQFQFFAQHYRAIRYDMRWAGNSEDLAASEPFVTYQDLYYLLAHLGIQRASLVGLSGGCRVAVDAAIAYPELVHKLVLIAPGISGYQFSAAVEEKGKEISAAFAQRDTAKAIEIFITMWTDGPYRTPEQVNPLIRERIREMGTHTVSKPRPARGHVEELEPPSLSRLAEVHAPTLTLVGDKDWPDIINIGQILNKGIAGSEMVVFPGVAHMLNMEKPDEFNRLVGEFLRKE